MSELSSEYEGYKRVTPVKVVTKSDPDADDHRYKYRFDKIHLDDLEGNVDDVFSGVDAEAKLNGGLLLYKYPGMTGVVVKESEVLAPEEAPSEEARRQAYYVTSILESAGYVSGMTQSKF